jgi:hypothetical protein
MTIEEILQKCGDSYLSNECLQVIDEFARQEAFAFFKFKNDYQKIEGMNHQHNITEIGLVSWIGAFDDKIWEAYKKKEQLKRY